MRCAILYVALMASLAHAAIAASPPAAAAPDPGLIQVPSQTFDELFRRPSTDLAGYRRAMIDAPAVEFREGWLKRMNETRGVARRIEPADARQITDQMAAAMHEAVTQALLAQGYEVVPTPAPGVLRLSPSITDLYVNAPFVPAPGIDVGVIHREAGEATMRLEVRDAATGALLARIADQETARTSGGYERATGVSNLFWFDAMFRQWAVQCVREIRKGSSP